MIRACLLSVCLIVGFAGTASAELAGRRLQVVGGCNSGGSISIDPDPALTGGIVVEGPASTSPETGTDGTVTVMPACGDDGLRIRVPFTFPVSVEVGGDRSLRLGNLAGPVTIVVNGSSVSAGALAGPVRIEGTGDGDMTIASLSGPTDIALHGSGDLAIGQATVSDLSVTTEGSGDVRIGGGTVTRLSLAMRGSGDVRIAGTVGRGSVSDAGDGDVSIDRVTGDLSEIQSGSGSIHVGTRDQGTPARPSITLPLPPIPPVPVINIQQPHFNFRADTGQDVDGLVEAVVKLALFAAASVGALLLARRLLRRRAAAPGLAQMRPEITRLAERLDAVARRTGALEQAVTSDEFDLDRRFRDIGADRPA